MRILNVTYRLNRNSIFVVHHFENGISTKTLLKTFSNCAEAEEFFFTNLLEDMING